MATEQEVRQKAQSLGLTKSKEDKAVEISKNSPNLNVDQIIQQVQ
jgi:hypothetical protein